MLGNHFFKRYRNPALTLIETDLVVGKVGNDITIIIYNSDTTKSFTSKIFINNTLRIQQVGNTNSITKKHTTNYYF